VNTAFRDAFSKLANVLGIAKATQFLQAQLVKMTGGRSEQFRRRRIGYSAKSPSSRRRSSVLTPRTNYRASGPGSLVELDARVGHLINEGHLYPSKTARLELRS
jgi:hypothetical protein